MCLFMFIYNFGGNLVGIYILLNRLNVAVIACFLTLLIIIIVILKLKLIKLYLNGRLLSKNHGYMSTSGNVFKVIVNI